MPPRREPRRASESNFLDITQFGETMAHAFQNAIRHPLPQRTPLETMYNLKLDHFMSNEGHEGAEKWLDHIEKTFQENFKKRFVPPEYIDRKKQEFTQLKQKNMSAHEYYRKFTDLSCYDPDTDGNQVEMFRCFKLGTKRKWRTFASAIPCTTYHEFSEILVRMEDSDNLPSNSEDDEDKNDNQRKDDRGKGFRDRDFGGVGGSGSPLCRRCNFRHLGKCKRSRGGGCYTCGQLGHRAAQFPQSQQRPQQSAIPPPAPIQQNFGSGSYGQTGRGGAYHYQGDAAPYASGQNQYSQDPYFQTGYSQDPEGYSSYSSMPASGSQWHQGSQLRQGEVAASSARPSRQSSQIG
ncbi:unnamed protein product [Malus baccata var. baccata]